MFRVAAALLCIAAGQVALWLVYPTEATRSLAWPALAAAAAAGLVTIKVRRWRAAETER